MSLFRLLLFSLFCAAAYAANPNVIVIYVDDMGYGDASCLNPQAKFKGAPNIDRLAVEGMTSQTAWSGHGLPSS